MHLTHIIVKFSDRVQQGCGHVQQVVHEELRPQQARRPGQVDLYQEGHEHELPTSLDC